MKSELASEGLPSASHASKKQAMSNWQGDTKMQISMEEKYPRPCVSATHNSFITKITTNKWISTLPSLLGRKKCISREFWEEPGVYWQYINNILSAIKHFSNTWLLSGKYSAGASSATDCVKCWWFNLDEEIIH